MNVSKRMYYGLMNMARNDSLLMNYILLMFDIPFRMKCACRSEAGLCVGLTMYTMGAEHFSVYVMFDIPFVHTTEAYLCQ